MTEEKKKSTPTIYEIIIKGRLDKSWAEWFEPMTITHTADGVTVLKGELPDQAALQGVLVNIDNLNLTLLSVNPLVENDDEST